MPHAFPAPSASRLTLSLLKEWVSPSRVLFILSHRKNEFSWNSEILFVLKICNSVFDFGERGRPPSQSRRRYARAGSRIENCVFYTVLTVSLLEVLYNETSKPELDLRTGCRNPFWSFGKSKIKFWKIVKICPEISVFSMLLMNKAHKVQSDAEWISTACYGVPFLKPEISGWNLWVQEKLGFELSAPDLNPVAARNSSQRANRPLKNDRSARWIFC